jgi:hypothetical protein
MTQDEIRMEYLLGKYKEKGLSSDEQDELRLLVTKKIEISKNSSIEDIVNTGLVIVGLQKFTEGLFQILCNKKE